MTHHNPRQFDQEVLLLATHNPHKGAEISAMLGSMMQARRLSFITAGDLNLPEPEETGISFEENAALKARAAAGQSGHVSLADDSGLCVTAMDNAPGIYSARFAAGDYKAAMEKIDTSIGGNPDRSAAFHTVMALAWPDGHVETVHGVCEGEIIAPPRGTGGFGYDPCFVPKGYAQSFGEMSEIEKEAISARAKAFRILIEKCF